MTLHCLTIREMNQNHPSARGLVERSDVAGAVSLRPREEGGGGARYPLVRTRRNGTGGAGTAGRTGRVGRRLAGALTRGSCHIMFVAGEPGEPE